MKKRNLKNKIISGALALCVAVGVLPLSAFAEDTAPTNSGTITAFTESAVVEIANNDTSTEQEIIATFPSFVLATIDGNENIQVPVTGWARIFPAVDIAYTTTVAGEFFYAPTLAEGYTLASTAILPNQLVKVGEVVHAPALTAGTDAESFSFQVTVADDGDPLTTDDLSFSIPLSGGSGVALNDSRTYNKPYNWSIDWDTENTADTPEVWYNGVADPGGANLGKPNAADSAGIPHIYPAAGTYTITITNNAIDLANPTIANNDAWLAAFGFFNGTAGANSATNKAKVTAILSGFTPLMTRTQAQITSATPQMHYEWADAFHSCTNLTGIGPGFSSGWDSVTTIQDYFAYNMFSGCTSLESMGNSFNMPQSAALETIGNSFASGMFYGCTSLESMGNSFNMPQSAALETIGNGFASSMFNGCTSLESMGNSFNMPQSAALETIGNSFAYNMFNDCKKLKTIGNHFTLPQGGALTKIGDEFARFMFSGCIGLESMGSNFNMPQSAVLKEIGKDFAAQLFNRCENLKSMGSGFTMPQSPALTSIGVEFAAAMFEGCTSLESMGDSFNLPQGGALEEIGARFAWNMFKDCTSLESMGDSFNLPQGGALTTIGEGFAREMFERAGDNLVINDVFRFPKVAPAQLNQSEMFWEVFKDTNLAANQSRTATSIINGNDVPAGQRDTFTGTSSAFAFADYDFIATYWGGTPAPKTVGATVTFDTDTIGGMSATGKPDPRPVTSGSTVTRPNNPSANGYTFENWYTDANFTTLYNFNTAVNGNITLYARWSNVPVIISGANQIVTQGQSASFTSSDNFSSYVDTDVTLNNGAQQTVHAAGTNNLNASAVEGSIIVTLTGAYTATLPVGTHSISVNGQGGSASTTFTVVAPAPTPSNPAISPLTGVSGHENSQTGHSSNTPLFVVLMFISALGLTTLFLTRKKYLSIRKK